MTDKHGGKLEVGSKVICDDCMTGEVTKFGGLGVFVRMDEDKTELDWAQDQVELQES